MSCPIQDSEIGKVCYLTVSESDIPEGSTQRRGGLHTEAPNGFRYESKMKTAIEHHWGMGYAIGPDELHGGFFMANNIDNTCAVFNALVTDKSVIDSCGGIEHLRSFIGEPYNLKANELVWLTDRTPHEALSQPKSGYRQFFRLVTSEISLWFEEHSTPNPKVSLPDFVQVIKGNKLLTDEKKVKHIWKSLNFNIRSN